jgi:diguanylate cyclase (GGDEF)-like protein
MPAYETITQPGVARIAVFDTSVPRAGKTAQVLSDGGFVVRTVHTVDALRRLVGEWRPHVVVAEENDGVLNATRRESDAVQIVLIGLGDPDRALLAAFGVHAWCDQGDGPERLVATVESAVRRSREVGGLLAQRAGLQRILDVAPRLNQLRAADHFALVAMRTFAETVDPAGTATSGVFAVQTLRPRTVQYHGMGRYEKISSEFDLPEFALDAMSKALTEGRPVTQSGAGIVVAVPATEHARAVMYLEGLEVAPELDDLCSVYANLIGQALANILLFERATIDGLTGLYNRAFGVQRLVETLSLGTRYPSPTSVLVLDVDHFKSVNDRWGHAAGDMVLTGLAATLRNCCRDTDIAVRLGGEEFLVVLPRTDEAQARVAAERARAAVGAWRGKFDSVELSASVSIGVACSEPGDRDALRLLERADDALYVAKREGRNRVVCAG